MNEEDFIKTAEERFDQVAGAGYRETDIGAIQFGSYLASLSRGSCVSILKNAHGVETHVSGVSVDLALGKSVNHFSKVTVHI